MKRTLILALAAILLASCGPTKHAVHVEMRHPSKSGVNLFGKDISVVYLENDNKHGVDFCNSMAEGFASTLEKDYGTGEGSIGIYRMRASEGADYSSKDSLFNLLMDTGSDVVFLMDTVRFGVMSVGGPSKVASPSSPDSSYVSEGYLPFAMTLYCFDAMDKTETVNAFSDTSVAKPSVYSNGKDDSTNATLKAWRSLKDEGWNAGVQMAGAFKGQWKHEMYSILYYDSEKWYTALVKAEDFDWKGAMDIWIGLLDTNDVLKKACAEYNISVACYMLGDYPLALEWLDLSDKTNKLPISDAMRKRIDARL